MCLNFQKTIFKNEFCTEIEKNEIFSYSVQVKYVHTYIFIILITDYR